MKDIISLIKGFSIEDKIILEKELEKETLEYRAKSIDQQILPNDISMDEIVSEVRKVRKGKDEK